MSSKSPPHGTGIDLLWARPKDLRPNFYNANEMDDDLFAQAVASVKKYGFVDPVTVRVVNEHYEIIDGEHRVRAAVQLNLNLVPIIVVDVDDDTAQELTLVLNELRGRPDRAKLQRILAGLAERHPIEELLVTLPFAREQFFSVLPPFPIAGMPGTVAPDVTRWVERMYRMPRDAADTLDAALAEAKEFEEFTEDWKALEVIAKRYLE